MTVELWNESAETYGANVEHIRFYSETNLHLVAAAGLRPGMRVVDLACGTGLTTRGILGALGGEGAVHAFDRSESMVEKAREGIQSPLARFITVDADDFARFVPEPVDRVLCNSAFFLFSEPSDVLREIRAVLRPTGRFLFNFPDQAFDFGDGRRSEFRRLVDACLDQPRNWTTPGYSVARIRALAAAGGFRIEDTRVLEIQVGAEDLLRFYTIEQIGAGRLPHLDPHARRRRFEEAFSRLSPDERVTYRWAQFVLALASRPDSSGAGDEPQP